MTIEVDGLGTLEVKPVNDSLWETSLDGQVLPEATLTPGRPPKPHELRNHLLSTAEMLKAKRIA